MHDRCGAYGEAGQAQCTILGSKSTGTRPLALGPAVVSARYSAPGEPRPILSQVIPVNRDPLARRNSSVPTMEGKKPCRSSVSSSLDQSKASRAGTHVLCCSFFSCRTRYAVLAASTFMPALDCLSYCKSTRLMMRCRQQQSDLNPIHAQFRHAPLSMHPSLSSQSLGKATVSNLDPQLLVLP